jgi:hypothetical protein
VALAWLENYQPGFAHTILGRLANSAGGVAQTAAGWATGNQQLADKGMQQTVVNQMALGGRIQTPATVSAMGAAFEKYGPLMNAVGSALTNPIFNPAATGAVGVIGSMAVQGGNPTNAAGPTGAAPVHAPTASIPFLGGIPVTFIFIFFLIVAAIVAIFIFK